MAIDEETGIIVYGPEIVSRGVVFETETGHLLQDAHCVVLEVVEELPPETPDRVERDAHPHPDRPAAVFFLHHRPAASDPAVYHGSIKSLSLKLKFKVKTAHSITET
ncbi:MAG: hypothetical protein MZV70_50640 [Desulfobacterales bacterium]|nr:hypothetical protein [Desulfobacterales bacterium]